MVVQHFYEQVRDRLEKDPVLRATGAPVLVITIAGPTFGTYGAQLEHAPMIHLSQTFVAHISLGQLSKSHMMLRS